MTNSKTYNVAGAQVEITANLYQSTVIIHITVDFSNLDKDEPDHSAHNIINYVNLPHYVKGKTYWWCKLSRTINCKTGSQARRIIKNALVKIDDAVCQAIIDRNARKSHMNHIFV
jgi:hypothetical protein